MIASPFDSPTIGVSEYHNKFGARYFASKFQAANNICIDYIAGNSDRKNITQPLIENQFGGGAAIDTTENDSKRKLALTGFIGLLELVPAYF